MADPMGLRFGDIAPVKYMHDSNQQSMPCLDPLVSIGNVASRSISTVSVHTICFSNQLVALHNICQTKNHSEFRPHDHVRLKEKESDFHACLDNKFSFKLSIGLCSVEEFGTGTRGDSIYNYCTMSLIAG
uniref:Uncharacterized protein n=2 Tax=Oryza sativa subsp. japonica TaxID=39947 RepID=Q8L668_ORYSJ|nr:Hypothetical protein [Oryza sativa Japonica Group]AAP51978.1 hypothetical protein LOC_Os10g03960 [Oryza sativa Japonica Group]